MEPALIFTHDFDSETDDEMDVEEGTIHHIGLWSGLYTDLNIDFFVLQQIFFLLMEDHRIFDIILRSHLPFNENDFVHHGGILCTCSDVHG